MQPTTCSVIDTFWALRLLDYLDISPQTQGGNQRHMTASVEQPHQTTSGGDNFGSLDNFGRHFWTSLAAYQGGLVIHEYVRWEKK